MTTLLKAQLCEISGDAAGKEIGAPVDVQFNPATLRVAISNKTAGGSQAGAQAKQKPGTGEVTVTFDLYFDTADEGTADAPIPVTRRTQIVEKFVRPRGATPALQSPPRVQFKWGGFLVQGVMESANIDLDLFAADGTPLRAKVGVSIKGQDPSYRYDPALLPPVAPGGDSAAPSGLPAGTPGTTGNAGPPTTVAEALPGESLAQLAARNGLDPTAWRALATGITEPLSLPAGREVPLPAATGGGGGAGAAAGGIALGSGPLAGATASGANPILVGQALARQGGVQGAIAGARSDAERSAAAASIAGFGLAPPSTGSGSRPFGGGIPLRPLLGTAGTAPVTPDPTIPGWQALAARPPTQIRAAGRIQPRSACACGCAPKRRG